MSTQYFTIFEIFVGAVGFGILILICAISCLCQRKCSYLRNEQIQREILRSGEQDRQPHSVYVIPFPGNTSQRGSEEYLRIPGYNQELHSSPQYSSDDYCAPPPSYHELGFKSDDLPPPYTEHNIPVITPPLHTDMAPSQTQLQT